MATGVSSKELAKILGVVSFVGKLKDRANIRSRRLAEDEEIDEKMTQMFQRVIGVISKPPQQRRRAEIELLLPWLRKRSELLEKAERDVLISLMVRCMYQKKQRDDLIITQGEIGNSFYIILSGKCSVYIDPLKTGEEQEVISKDTLKKKEQASEYMALNGKTPVMDRSKYGRHISAMGIGKSFGEVALISDDSVRNASVIADEETDLLVIERELFNDTLKAKQQEEYQERSAFVNKCPLFANWNARFKKLLEMSLFKISLPFGSPIVKQGEPVTGLYFIIKGEGKIVIDSTMHETQYPRLYDPSNSLLAKELGKAFVKKVDKTRESLQQEHVRIRRRQGYAAAEKRLSQKSVTQCFVDETEIIGDAELILGLDTYIQTVVCTANTELFLLDSKNIDRLIVKKHPLTLDILRLQLQKKIKARSLSQIGSQIDLYPHLLETLEITKPKRLLANNDNSLNAVSQEQKEKEIALKQLVNLYLKDRSPLIEPYVPGAVYYKTKAVQKSRRIMSEQSISNHQQVTGALRLERARKAAKRQPRSRRELERLTIAQDPDEITKLQDRNHAVNRFLQREPSGSVRPRHSNSTMNGYEPADAIFALTEPQLPDGGDEVDLNDINETEVKEMVINVGNASDATNATRSRVICTMMDKNAQQNAMSKYKNLVRPKSAPMSHNSIYEEDEGEVFDTETSDAVLGGLEDKLKTFYDQNANNSVRRMVPQIKPLKRFQISKPDDVPVPGGTVYVRQKTCKYPPGSQVSQHQHIRRFIIPKDAYAIATKSMALIESAMENEQYGYPSKLRPSSAPSVQRQGSSASLKTKKPQRPKTAISHA